MILEGNALEVLKTLPNDSVQLVVTSPPYMGLRSYLVKPLIWDEVGKCEHEFGKFIENPKFDKRSPKEKIENRTDVGNNIKTLELQPTDLGQNCVKCGAWRGTLGLEPTVDMYIHHLIDIFREVKRVLKPDGSCFVNISDSYTGSNKVIGAKPDNKFGENRPRDSSIKTDWSKINIPTRSLMQIPSRFAISMVDELKFVLRNEIIWQKPNAMPESAKNRWTRDFEMMYFFTKSGSGYKFNTQYENITGVNRIARTVWAINTKPSKIKHVAQYPEALVERPILACSDVGDVVLDPFSGAGTTGVVAKRLGREYIGVELSNNYVNISQERIEKIDGNR